MTSFGVAGMIESPRRLKARIERVGGFDGYGLPINWVMDCGGEAIGCEITSDGQMFLGGYSISELRGIAAARSDAGAGR